MQYVLAWIYSICVHLKQRASLGRKWIVVDRWVIKCNEGKYNKGQEVMHDKTEGPRITNTLNGVQRYMAAVIWDFENIVTILGMRSGMIIL